MPNAVQNSTFHGDFFLTTYEILVAACVYKSTSREGKGQTDKQYMGMGKTTKSLPNTLVRIVL